METCSHAEEIQNLIRDTISLISLDLGFRSLTQNAVEDLSKLEGQVGKPYVIAFVGLVNEGKSTLVNALLENDLAATGPIETTATINFFEYGATATTHCYRYGESKPVSFSQDQTKRRECGSADSLESGAVFERVVFAIDSELLRNVTFVDTPGLDSIIDGHQDLTAKFVKLSSQLRSKIQKDSLRITQEADAIVLLKSIATRNDQKDILIEFRDLLGPNHKAFNTVVAISRIDLQGELRKNSGQEIAKKHLRSGLCDTAIAISAGVDKLVQLCRADSKAYSYFFDELIQLDAPSFEARLVDQGLFWKSPASKRFIPVPWSAIKASAIYARESANVPEEILDELEGIAGVKQLRTVMLERILPRSGTMRNYRIVCNAEAILCELSLKIQSQKLLKQNKRDQQIGDSIGLLKQLEPDVLAMDKVRFEGTISLLREQMDSVKELYIERLLSLQISKFAKLRRTVEVASESIQMLHLLTDCKSSFSIQDLEELESLFDLFCEPNAQLSCAANFACERQRYWQGFESVDRSTRLICNAASKRYSMHLHHLSIQEQNGTR